MTKTILKFGTFTLAAFIVVAAFVTARSYTQLSIAIIIYPLLVWLVFKTFLADGTHIESMRPAGAYTGGQTIAGETLGIADVDKRAFLKLVGATSLSLFLYSIINKAPKNLFSKGILPLEQTPLETPSEGTTAQMQSQPAEGYRISEIDDDIITFYGFTKKDGGWYIMRLDTNTGSFRYARGDVNFSANWAKREKLKYDFSSAVF